MKRTSKKQNYDRRVKTPTRFSDLLLMCACRSRGRRYRNLYHIGLASSKVVADRQMHSIHRDLQSLVIHFKQQVMIVDDAAVLVAFRLDGSVLICFSFVNSDVSGV